MTGSGRAAAPGPPRPRRQIAWLVLSGLLMSTIMAGVLSFYASSNPDGLESVAAQQGFIDSAVESGTAGLPLAGYRVGDGAGERFSGGLAGICGVGITLVIAFALFYWLAAHRRGEAKSDRREAIAGG